MSEDRRHEIQELLEKAGGLTEGTATEVARELGVPEAEVYGVGSFYHLLSRPHAKVRVCTGLSCRMGGADEGAGGRHRQRAAGGRMHLPRGLRRPPPLS